MKDFAEKLKEFLRGNKSSWTSVEYGSGGCETCGYGADEFDAVDMDELDKQIDEFCASFEKENKQ